MPGDEVTAFQKESIHRPGITLAQRTDRFGGTTRTIPVRPSLDNTILLSAGPDHTTPP